MPPRRRTARPRTGATAREAVKPVIFAQDPHALLTRPFPVTGREPDLVVRLLRPDDLVAVQLACFGLELVKVSRAVPELVPSDKDAYLVVGFTFQHVGEQAFYPADGEVPTAPVDVLVAEPSRLVFDVPDRERIPFSTSGILEALSRLPLRVAPLATPRQVRKLQLDPILVVPGGLVLAQGAAGLVLTRDRARPVPVTTAAELIAHSTALRTARALVAREGAVDLSGLVRTTEERAATARPGLDAIRERLGDVLQPDVPIRPSRQKPRPPRPDETAIEAPYRLVISPSALGGFAHATEPQAAPTDETRIELWHTRLGVRDVQSDGSVTVDEKSATQRVVRAIWARDKDGVEPTADDNLPFRMSLCGFDRVKLVRQSADPAVVTPQPVDAARLYLSSLGAWLDLHGSWDVQPYEEAGFKTLESWDHIAPMGRDQYVKVVYPGYLFPFGHRCSLVKVTERRIDPGTNVAWLYQRKFLIVRQPVISYAARTMPFIQVRLRPLVTPDIEDPLDPDTPATFPRGGANGWSGQELFFPIVKGTKFEFTLDCLDNDGRRVIVKAPLLFVSGDIGRTQADRTFIAARYTTPDSGPKPRGIPAQAQSVAFAPSTKPGTTAFETDTLRFTGDPGVPGALTSTPHLTSADVVVPAMKHLAPRADPVEVHYATPYLTHGFEDANTDAQIFLELADVAKISFGGGAAGATTAKSGGFIQPDIPVRGLSRTLGTVGQTDSVVDPPPNKQPFDPLTYLDGVLPKLFGLFSLVDILRAVGLDHAPNFVTEALDEVAGWLADLTALEQVLRDGIDQLDRDATGAATDALRTAADTAKGQLAPLAAQYTARLTSFTDAITALRNSGDRTAFETDAPTALGDLAASLTALTGAAQSLSLPPVVKAQLERLTGALTALQNSAADIAARIASIVAFVNGADPSKLAVKASFEWRPKLQNYPAGSTPDTALFYVDEDGLLLSIEARASGTDGVGVDVLAQLSHFGLNLFEDNTLITIGIDRLSFRASNGRKPEVDVVMNEMAWQGVLGFIETLESLIPFDAFSDPPYVDVDGGGVKAGFDLALPSVAVGVFSLENISLGADVSVPFLGDAVTIGFNFCTREKPFRLTVLCVGGGGFVGLRMSPKGIVLLEMSLEACAQLAVDLGVASGSVSISVGVYLRLEGDDGSLTGYFRIRGEVDVLGLISASITLELSLTYEFDSGKLVGRASIEIEIEIFMFSFSVSVSCERRLAGSNGDPTFAEFLGIADGTTVPHPGAPDGGVPAWTHYCAAFAEA